MKKSRLAVIAVSFVPLFCSLSAYAGNYNYIALGDSISAGFLASTATEPSRSLTREDVELVLKNETPSGLPQEFENKTTYSWPTGVRISSIGKKLEAALQAREPGSRLSWVNGAESGQVVVGLPTQAKNALDEIKRINPRGDFALVTIMIGANDACGRLDKTPEEAEKIRKHLRIVFAQISEYKPVAQTTLVPVSVSSVPKIYSLGTPEILSYPMRKGFTCRDVRTKIYAACPQLADWKNADELRVRTERVDFINNVMRETVRDARVDFPALSLAFDETLGQFNFDGSDLASDCFHPGMRGQPKLANVLWNAMPWF